MAMAGRGSAAGWGHPSRQDLRDAAHRPASCPPAAGDRVVDLAARRAAAAAAVRATAGAPVRHLPAGLLDALDGSWGTPEELGLPSPMRRLVVAR